MHLFITIIIILESIKARFNPHMLLDSEGFMYPELILHICTQKEIRMEGKRGA